MTASRSSFVVPEGLRFECTRCGDCCRGWNVMLGPGEAERLAGLRWDGLEADLVGVTPSARVPGLAGRRAQALARREDGACVFLGPDNLCRIQRHFGEDAKPLMCRLYPFGFFPVGERVAVDVSFACRSVSRGEGRPVRERIPEWTQLVHETPSESGHPYSRKYRIDGELLWEIEHQLVELLKGGGGPLIDRVRIVSEFMRLATTSDPRTDAARKLREVMARALPEQVRARPFEGTMDATQRAVFFHLLFLHLNPTPDVLHRASGKKRKREIERRVAAANAFERAEAHPWVDNRPRETTFRDVEAVETGFLESRDGGAFVERYLESKILGQRFMREGEKELALLEAVPRLLLLYPMIVWTSKALASEGAASGVRPNDVRKAIRLLDRTYGEVRLSELPSRQRKAWRFILLETELALCASRDMLGTSPSSP